MNVGRKLVLIVIVSVAMVTIPSAGLIYYFTKQKLLSGEASAMVAETKTLAAINTRTLQEAEASLQALSRLLKSSLNQPVQAGDIASFDKIVQRYPDRAWRNRRENFDGNLEAGIFLPPDASMNEEQKTLHIRSKRVIDVFGSSVKLPFSNVWLLTPDKTEVIYDHSVTDFSLIMAADTDYTKTPWITLGNPKNNPQRALRWTPPLFDPVPKRWMVSAVLPFDVKGRWQGNIGHDIYLNNLFPALFKDSQRYKGEIHFLIDAAGNYIEAGPWQAELEANPQNFKPNLRNHPDLLKLFEGGLVPEPHAFDHEVSLRGEKYLAVGLVMQPIGWRYYRLVPINQILAPMRHVFFSLTLMVIFIGLLIGILIESAVKRNIINRLQVFANAVRSYGAGELDARAELAGDDEIANTSQEFDAMANNLKATLDAIPDLLFDLGLDGRYYAAHTPIAELLAVPHEELIGKTVREVLPADAADIIMSALEDSYHKGWSQGQQFELQLPSGKHWFELSIARKALSKEQPPRFIVLSRDITDRKLSEIALKDSLHLFQSIIDTAPIQVFWKDINSRYLGCNKAFALDAELESPADVIGKDDFQLLWANRAEHYRREDSQVMESGVPMLSYEHALERPNGKITWARSSKVPLKNQNNETIGLLGIDEDITERKLVENDLRIAAIAFEAQEGMMVTDANYKILRVNKAFTTITGYSLEDVVGETPNILSSGKDDSDFYESIWGGINSQGIWDGEVWSRRKNGEFFPEHLTVTAVKDSQGIVTNYVATLSDITKIKLAEGEIKQLAFYDSLTGLPNRRLLQDRLKQTLASSARSNRKGALIFVDLDNFKTLNDTLGHDIGDELLKQVAGRLTSCVREGDTVARFGGDEFVLILEDLSEQDFEAATQTEAIGEKILATLNQPYLLGMRSYQSSTSIGVTLFQDHTMGMDELLKQADIAMYQAKKAGRNTLRFFDPKMQASIDARADLEDELRKALEQKQFELYYQIQVDSSALPTGAEVLIRWIHPERGLIAPFSFISLAEDTGLIVPIGQWVIETACLQLKAWQHTSLMQNFSLSVNVSPTQFRQSDFVKKVRKSVQAHGINPSRLKLELTESLLLENVEETIKTMNALKEIGVRFSLDDFGTGYSSLQYLKQLPLDQLKIDQSFVNDIATDDTDKAIVRTIIAMAQSMGLEVIAEGVETEEQLELLRSKGCMNFQGYLFGKPVPLDIFEQDLAKLLLIECHSN